MQRQSRDFGRGVPLTVKENKLITEARKLASLHTNKIQMLKEFILLAKRNGNKQEVAELKKELALIVSTSSTANRDAGILRDLEEKVRQAHPDKRKYLVDDLKDEVERIKTIKKRNLEIELKKQGFNLGGEGVYVRQIDVDIIQINKSVTGSRGEEVGLKIILRQNNTLHGIGLKAYRELPLDTFVIISTSGWRAVVGDHGGALDKFDEFIKEVVGNKTFLVDDDPYFINERIFKKIRDYQVLDGMITVGLYQSKQQRGKDVKKTLDIAVNRREGKDHKIPSKVFDFLSDEATNPYMESASASARRGGKRRRKKRTKKKSRKKKKKTLKKKRKRRRKTRR